MSTTALHRHKTIHLAALVKAAREERTEEDLDRGEDRLDQVQSLVEKARGILETADDQRTAPVAVRELRGTLELLAKLTGQLQAPESQAYTGPVCVMPPGTNVQVNSWERPEERRVERPAIDIEAERRTGSE